MRDSGKHFAATARRLREVKEASRSFLALAALDQMCEDAAVMARVARDVAEMTEQALADPHDHNWLLLYRGSVLDD